MPLPMKGRLLVADIDGTLINEQFRVPEQNVGAINQFQKDGGIFSLATGRGIAATMPLVNQFQVTCPVIISNGSMLYDPVKDQVLWAKPLPNSCKQSVLNVLKRFPNIGVEVHTDRFLYVLRMTDFIDRHVTNEHLQYKEVTVDEVMNLSWIKILYSASPEELTPLRRYTQEHPLVGAYYLDTGTIYYELQPEETGKGAALEQLAQMLHIPRQCTAAIGNFYNDADMVKRAGVGAFVKDAPAELHTQADYIACRCEKGAMRDFILYLYRHWTEK